MSFTLRATLFLLLLFRNSAAMFQTSNNESDDAPSIIPKMNRMTLVDPSAQIDSTTSTNPADIVAIVPNRGSVFRNSLINSLFVSAHRSNVSLEIRDCGSFNADLCNEVFEQSVESEEQPKVYIIWPINKSINDWMRVLHDVRNATIVQMLNLPDEEGWEYTAAYAGQNEVQLGIVPASMMVDAMASRNIVKPKVLVLSYAENIPKGHRIRSAFEDSFKRNYSDAEIGVVYPAGSSSQSAYLAILDFFQTRRKNGEMDQEIHGIFCMGDVSLTGAYQALEDMGSGVVPEKNDLSLVGMGCNGARELLESGAQYSTALSSPYLIGTLAVASAVEYIQTGNITKPLGFAPNPAIRADKWDTMMINYLGESYAVDELCTWDVRYERAAGPTDIGEVDDICQYINCEYIPERLFFVGYAMVGINYVLAIAAGVLLYIYREKQIMKMAQPCFLAVVSVGCIVDTSSIIFMSADNRNYSEAELDVACFTWPWLLALGHMMTTATLVSKMYRVKMVCMADGTVNNLRRVKVTAKQASVFIFGFLSLDLIILSCWYGLDPFRWTLTVSRRDLKYYIADAYGSCESETIIFPVALIIVHFAVLIYANILVYQTRQIHKISDSKYVAIALFNSIQLLLVAMPVLMLVNDNVAVSYIIRICFVFLNNFWVIILVVYSKLYLCVMGRGDEIPSLHNMRKSFSNNNSSIPSGLYRPSGFYCTSCQERISNGNMQQLLSNEMAVLCANEKGQSEDENGGKANEIAGC